MRGVKKQNLRLHDNIALQKTHAMSKNILHVAHNLTGELPPRGLNATA